MSEDDDLLAAELALGLLGDDERRAAEARAAGDAPFAAAVARWHGHGLAMLDAREEPPRPSLWAEVTARLPANDTAPVARAPSAGRGWRVATFAASAAALALGVVALERPAPAPPPALRPASAPLVAMLSGADSKAVVAVNFDPGARRLTLSSVALQPGAHSAELWVIPADNRPRSLGILRPDGAIWRAAPAAAGQAIAPGVTLAVSIEPLGGSPTGLPTGPVVLTGKIQAI